MNKLKNKTHNHLQQGSIIAVQPLDFLSSWFQPIFSRK